MDWPVEQGDDHLGVAEEAGLFALNFSLSSCAKYGYVRALFRIKSCLNWRWQKGFHFL